MVSAQHSTTLSRTPLRVCASAPVVTGTRSPLGSIALPDGIPNNAVYVSPRLYSGFLEHLGRCIYGGIVDDPNDPSPKEKLAANEWSGDKAKEDAVSRKGRLPFRIDVMHELAREMGVKVCDWSALSSSSSSTREQRPLLRWPGGNFVSNYHWQDGIGALDARPTRIELAWGATESNLFGTDEYVEYCRVLGVEPYVCLNMGTGTLDEALAWLEYCNGTADTHWARLRRKNTGRDAPHAIRFWGLGNEMWGEWQVGRMNAEEYTRAAQRWSHALKLVDPSIVLVSCGKEGGTAWDWTVLRGLTGIVDMHSVHYYSMLGHQKQMRADEKEDEAWAKGNFSSYEKNVFGPATAEAFLQSCARLIDTAQMERWADRPLEAVGDAVANTIKAPIGIALDEFNVWDDHKATPTRGLEQHYDFTDALATVAWYHVLVRNAARVPIACLAQSVNVLSPLMVSRTSTLRQITYFPVSLFATHMTDAVVLQHTLDVDTYVGPTYPVWVQQLARPAYVDVVCVRVRTSGDVHVSVLNRHPKVVWQAPIELLDVDVDEVEVHTLYSDDLAAVNTFDAPDTVVPSIKRMSADEWKGQAGVYPVRPHSWSLFLFKVRKQ